MRDYAIGKSSSMKVNGFQHPGPRPGMRPPAFTATTERRGTRGRLYEEDPSCALSLEARKQKVLQENWPDIAGVGSDLRQRET